MTLARLFPARGTLLALALAGLLGSAAQPARAEDPAAEPGAAAAEPEIPWVKDWAKAVAQAKAEGKDLLIDFTGSDWCGWCVKLEGEVFSEAKFLEQATKQFVFVFLDFPRGAEPKKAVVDPAMNEKLKEAYGVQGFPTIILANAEGLPYARTGYQDGGPEPYLAHLAELRTKGVAIKALAAKGKSDAAAFKEGFPALAEAGFLAHPDWAWTLAQAEKADADGKLGFKAIVERERAAQRSKAEEAEIAKFFKGKRKKEDIDWESVHGLLKASKDLNGQALLQLAAMTADWLSEKGRHAEAKAMYALPLRDPELAAQEELKKALEERMKACDEAAAKPAEAPKEGEAK